MSAIDVIKDMSNSELVNYYEYCIDRVYYEYRHQGVNYHSNPRYRSIYVGEVKFSNLHYNNEMSLLNEMWDRFMNGSIFEQCWWRSRKVFQTNISLPFKREELVEMDVMDNQIERVKETIEYNGDTFEFLASGTKRKTYLAPCKTYVIKIPKEPQALGLLENKTESEIYKANPNSIYAKCELIDNGWLKMEFVEPKYFTKDDDYPSWTLDIAEHQVGYNLNGELVAYDYGSKI